MPSILALDTSSDFCSVCLYHNNTFFSVGELAPRKHAQLLMPMIQALLNDHGLSVKDLDGIAFGRGPGSFTGLRIAAGVAQGLAYGASCKVLPISNLKALALQVRSKASIEDDSNGSEVLVAIDARMDEVYWSYCRVDKVEDSWQVSSEGGEHVSKPEDITLSSNEGGCIGAGSGYEFVSRFPAQIQKQITEYDSTIRPHAEFICHLAVADYAQGITCAAENAAPVYIRDEVAWKKLPGRE